RYRSSHPKLRAAEAELAILEGAIDERREQIATLGKAGALTGGNSDSAEQSLDDLEVLRNKLESRRETIRREASELNSKLIRIRGIVTEKDRVEDLLEETKRALDEVQVESQNDLSRNVEIVAFGKIPDGPIDDKRKPAALGAAVFGALGTLAGFVLLTLIGGRLRFSDDLDARASGLLGAVVGDAGEDEVTDAAGRIRNELDLRWPPEPARPLVIGFAATSAGAGATGLVAALGCHYAASGLKVMLIDANTDVPASGQYSDSSASRTRLSLADAANRCSADSVSFGFIEAASEWQRNQGARGGVELSFEELRHLLDTAREGNDVVLVDLGVLKAGRQAAVGAALADRVIAVSAHGESKQRIKTALDLLDRLAPGRQLLILNRMPADDPQLAPASTSSYPNPTRFAWLNNFLNT
ncbi:MAG: hypothetical protein PVI83_07995, partial [Lysobacterales bacterium]